MYQDFGINDIELAINRISPSDNQYEKGKSSANKEVAISSRLLRLYIPHGNTGHCLWVYNGLSYLIHCQLVLDDIRTSYIHVHAWWLHGLYVTQVVHVYNLVNKGLSYSNYSQLILDVNPKVLYLRQPRLVCNVCTKTITKKNSDRLTHFLDGNPVCCDRIWNQTICPKHLYDGTPICCGCMRLKTSNNATYINLGDGREICPDCYPTAIFDIRQCDPLITKCNEFFRTLNMDLPDDVRVFLVDNEEMDRLCCEQELRMVFGLSFEADTGTVTGVTSCSRKENFIVVEQQCHEDDEYRTGIAILFGLPRIMTQAILTHEMMHVWFRSKGIESGQLEQKQEEGMCQVIGWKWLDWLDSEMTASSSSATTSHEQAQFLRKLVEAYKVVVEEHDSYEYGQGFREVKGAVETFGLENTIDHMITRGKLPARRNDSLIL